MIEELKQDEKEQNNYDIKESEEIILKANVNLI